MIDKAAQEPWKTLISVALGWLLGLLSTVGIQYLTKNRERRELKAGIAVELTNILIHLVSTTFLAAAKVEGVDKDLLSWSCDKLKPVKDKLSKLELDMLEMIETTLATWTNRLRTDPSAGGKGLNLRKENIPFLDSKCSVLPSLKTDVQNRLIKVMQRIDAVNQLVVKLDFYHGKTFENLTPENYEAVNKNYYDGLASISTVPQMTNARRRVLPVRLAPSRWATRKR